MSMNLSLQRLSTSSNAQHAYQFDCTFTSRNVESHSRMPKPDLSTCGNSHVFHRLFTSFWRSSHIFGFCVVCVFLLQSAETVKKRFSDHPWQFQIKRIPDNLQLPSFKPVAPWQVAGNISFYSYLIRCNVVQNRCTSFCYAIMMLMGGLGYSWITPATIWWFASCFFWFVFILLIRLKSDF